MQAKLSALHQLCEGLLKVPAKALVASAAHSQLEDVQPTPSHISHLPASQMLGVGGLAQHQSSFKNALIAAQPDPGLSKKQSSADPSSEVGFSSSCWKDSMTQKAYNENVNCATKCCAEMGATVLPEVP